MRLIDADELQNVMDENIEIHKKLLAGEKNPDEKDFLCSEITLLRCIKEFIDVRKTIDAEPVRYGKWIPFKGETGVEAFGYTEYTVLGFGCSICGADVDVSEEYFKYCPLCGAKMDLEE